MEFIGKEKRIYHGIWIAFVAFVVFPLAFFFLLRFAINHYNNYSEDLLNSLALGFAALVGFLFGMICLVCGLIQDMFSAFLKRIRERFEYFDFISKEGNSWYFHEFIHDGGIIMWLFLLILVIYALLSLAGFSYFFTWYYSL